MLAMELVLLVLHPLALAGELLQDKLTLLAQF
jgi:hypothetical protein